MSEPEIDEMISNKYMYVCKWVNQHNGEIMVKLQSTGTVLFQTNVVYNTVWSSLYK